MNFGNEITEIPYVENFKSHNDKDIAIVKNNNINKKLAFLKKRRYKLQFIISFFIAIIFLIILFFQVYQNKQKEKISKELLDNYYLTTLYSNSEQYQSNKTSITTESPFVIGMIKIDKINLSYPILSQTTEDLLKISVCRFIGPMPNEIGNLCIAGHNYVDNNFFSRLNELQVDDKIEIYDFGGKMKEYHIFRKYEVEANDLSCTEQDVGNSKIVTLLTCNNSNRKRRIVVQAK